MKSLYHKGDEIYFFINVPPGRNFLNRALMNKKLDEVAPFLSQFPCSSGFSYNVATLDSLKVMNFEVSPSGVVATEINGYDYHFNM